jgi:hypothetical protein
MPGNPGGPGRPVGSRNKLEESMLRDLCAEWEAHGIEAIRRVLRESPGDFLKICASLLPRQIKADVDQTVYLLSDHPLTAEEWEKEVEAGEYDPQKPN